jgi:hypothetical protein
MVAPSLDTIAVALADEGVPLRAIARVTHIPSADLRERLAVAKGDGSLVAMPCEDWPIGFPRDRRIVQLARLAGKRPQLELVVQRLFGLSPVGVRLLLTMLQREYLDKSCIAGMSARCADVHIHHLRRRLKLHDIAIETVWGRGFRLAPADRRRALDLILAVA